MSLFHMQAWAQIQLPFVLIDICYRATKPIKKSCPVKSSMNLWVMPVNDRGMLITVLNSSKVKYAMHSSAYVKVF